MKTRDVMDDEYTDDENENGSIQAIGSQLEADVPRKRHIDDLAKMIGSVVPSSIDFSWTTEHVLTPSILLSALFLRQARINIACVNKPLCMA
jgi:hypothetical protein